MTIFIDENVFEKVVFNMAASMCWLKQWMSEIPQCISYHGVIEVTKSWFYKTSAFLQVFMHKNNIVPDQTWR